MHWLLDTPGAAIQGVHCKVLDLWATRLRPVRPLIHSRWDGYVFVPLSLSILVLRLPYANANACSKFPERSNYARCSQAGRIEVSNEAMASPICHEFYPVRSSSIFRVAAWMLNH